MGTESISHESDGKSKRSNIISNTNFNPGSYAIIGGIVTGICLTCGLFMYRRFVKRIPSADHVHPSDFGRTIKGYVTSVGDADNFRLYHTPGLGWGILRNIPTERKLLKDNTIHIRLAGVDAPEGPHFGKIAQPFYFEALDFLNQLVSHRTVRVKLGMRDRYGRIVGNVHVPRFFFPFSLIIPRVNVSLEMLKAGLATVYRSQGALYGGMLEIFEHAEANAKASKKGMWTQSKKKYISPGDYKKAQTNDSPAS